MKKLCLLLIILSNSWSGLAQNLPVEKDTTQHGFTETPPANPEVDTAECKEKCKNKTVKDTQGCIDKGTHTQNLTSEFLAYTPSIILAIALTFILFKLKGFSLVDALSTDHDPAKKIPSASRLIAFISGISALVFSYGLFTFYTVIYIKTGCFPEVEKLTNALIALGIGVVPYSINKVAGAIERR